MASMQLGSRIVLIPSNLTMTSPWVPPRHYQGCHTYNSASRSQDKTTTGSTRHDFQGCHHRFSNTIFLVDEHHFGIVLEVGGIICCLWDPEEGCDSMRFPSTLYQHSSWWIYYYWWQPQWPTKRPLLFSLIHFSRISTMVDMQWGYQPRGCVTDGHIWVTSCWTVDNNICDKQL